MSELRDEKGLPLRLFQLDGRPVTDRSGELLFNMCGFPLVVVSQRKNLPYYLDSKGGLLYDCHGRNQEEPGFNPADGPQEPSLIERCKEPVFALDGHPLTGQNCLPLVNAQGRLLVVFSPKGKPVTDIDGREITDSKGVILNAEERPFLSKEKIPVRIFDELGRPLTDWNGYPLSNILGFPLILSDEHRNPVSTLNGYPLIDADGLTPWDEGFDLLKPPKFNNVHKPIVCGNKEIGIAFDVCGHPLTDMFGHPLVDIEGNPLVKKVKKVWVTTTKDPAIIIEKRLIDNDALKYLTNSRGTPILLFDKRGYPLTDHEGMPLISAQGILLLRFNQVGEPISDYQGYPVFDCRGNPIGTPAFRPCKSFASNPARDKLVKFKKTGVQYYDIHGMPLTNRDGIPLITAQQEIMVNYDQNFLPVEDIYGREIYDILGLPVGSSLNKALKGPTGEPIRLYNKLGKPLTDVNGNTLKTINNALSLKTSAIGRIEADSKGYPLQDADGCPMSLPNRFLATKSPPNEVWVKALVNVDGSPLLMYDMTGEPLTDAQGRILFDNSGTPLITISPKGYIQERNGEFLLDTDGYTNYRISGRALREKIAIYDKHDRPLIGPSGYILRMRTGMEVVKFDASGYPVSTIEDKKVYDSQGRPIFTPLSDMYKVPTFKSILVYDGELQLFDCEDRPLLDITGEVLFTSRGVPLVNVSEGQVRSDALGRPVFDVRGIPVCNPGGVWRDQKGKQYRLYDSEFYPVTDARGKELLDIDGLPLIRRDSYGHPMFSADGELLCDAEGHRVPSDAFLPSTAPPSRRTSSLMESKEVPLRLFDLDGRPLTDDCGKPLETSKGKPILDLTKGLNRITDQKGRPVFDWRRIPVGCNSTSPIRTARGEPIVLFNKDGNPLMTRDGCPIRRVDGTTLLDFDHFGRPISADGSGLYDLQGNPAGSPDCVLACQQPASQAPLMSLEGKPVKVYDKSGHPLTDDCGNLLYRADGEPVKAEGWGDNKNLRL